jgi:hypothetical protein
MMWQKFEQFPKLRISKYLKDIKSIKNEQLKILSPVPHHARAPWPRPGSAGRPLLLVPTARMWMPTCPTSPSPAAARWSPPHPPRRPHPRRLTSPGGIAAHLHGPRGYGRRRLLCRCGPKPHPPAATREEGLLPAIELPISSLSYVPHHPYMWASLVSYHC